MSGVLRKIYKELEIVFITLLIVSELVCILIHAYFCAIVILMFGILAILMVGMNKNVVKQIKTQRAYFDAASKVRNVNYLLVGDMLDARSIVPDGLTFVQIKCPNRGYRSTWEILRHTHSILQPHGTVVCIIKKSKFNDDSFTVFDTSFFHSITIKKYNLNSLKKYAKLPLIFDPIRTIKFLFSREYRNYIFIECPVEDLKEFCTERGYNLIYLEL